MSKCLLAMSQREALKMLRIAYPLWAVVGMFSLLYVPSVTIVSGDALATASNIMAHETLFRFGILGALITQFIFILVPLALYQLFKPLKLKAPLMMIIFAFLSIPIAMLAVANRMGALILLHNAGSFAALSTEQVHALMMFLLQMDEQSIIIASIFWGLWLLPLASLVKGSGYFPKVFGTLLSLAGAGYIFGSIAKILIPDITMVISVLEILTIGEVIFLLWITIKGANLPSE